MSAGRGFTVSCGDNDVFPPSRVSACLPPRLLVVRGARHTEPAQRFSHGLLRASLAPGGKPGGLCR